MSHPLLVNRYEILKELGSGGMGAVYLVKDRLTNQQVALKKVLQSAVRRQPNPNNTDYDEFIALAVEFRTLASLRHPHVVEVLDYGFDEQGNPFFTMEYLPEASEITDRAQTASFDDRINYWIQILQALMYLHRRSILHRDIKPANILVNNQQSVKVLDFGLAIDTTTQSDDVDDTIAGTVAYLAPEIIQGNLATVQSDLYAVGMLVYEMFSGQYPFNLKSMTTLITEVLMKIPAPLELSHSGISQLVSDLLDKDPDNRPQQAIDVIQQIHELLERDIPEEDTQIRESFLRASRFIGRDSELTQLTDSIQDLTTENPKSSFWLLGGESGVGKSRLIEETRIHALVQQVRVLRGQAVEDGGTPFQVWRDILRPLLLWVDVTDLEASILKEVVSDIETIIVRSVDDAPSLVGKANIDRIALTIVDLLKRISRPLLIILEDLQWTRESLSLLQSVIKVVDQISTPIMLIGSYRSDEMSSLPDQFPEMTVIQLARFDIDNIHELSLSMLGTQGNSEELDHFLMSESEGNVFFITEILRTLAEEVGRLDQIASNSLPAQVMAGGIQTILQRRLSRIPETLQELLKIAAIIGRELDKKLLVHLSSQDDVESFITVGANTAVLDVIDEKWRFAHDKLRQAVLMKLESDEKQVFHRNVAQAIEVVYPEDISYAEALATHWDAANEPEKAIKYIVIASDRIVRFVADYDRAEAMIKRGLELVARIDNAKGFSSQLYRLLGEVEKRRANYSLASEHYQKALSFADGRADLQVPALYNLSEIAQRQGERDKSVSYAQQTYDVAGTINDIYGQALALRYQGKAEVDQGNLDKGFELYSRSVDLLMDSSDQHVRAVILNDMGIARAIQGNNDAAETYFERSLAIHRKNGNRASIANLLTNLGMLANLKKDYPLAHQRFSESATISQEIGYPMGVATTMGHLGMVMVAQEDYEQAISSFENAITILRNVNSSPMLATQLINQAYAYTLIKQVDNAVKNIMESLVISEDLQRPPLLLSALVVTAAIHESSDNVDECLHLVAFLNTQEKIPNEYRTLMLEPLLERLKRQQPSSQPDNDEREEHTLDQIITQQKQVLKTLST